MSTQKIVSRWDSSLVLFECELPKDLDSGMAMRHALEKATEAGANLHGANLVGANLSGANLSGANLSGANLGVPATLQIERLDAVREIILDDAARLEMTHWHGGDEWRSRTCAEEAVCGTTHCLAGWLQVCSTEPDMRSKDPEHAGFLIAPIAAPLFFSGSEKVLAWLRDREYVKQLEGVMSRLPLSSYARLIAAAIPLALIGAAVICLDIVRPLKLDGGAE